MIRDAASADDLEALADEVIGAELAATGEDTGSDAEAANLDDVNVLLEDVYAAGRRLARLGECTLMTSLDGLKAFFVGTPPDGTSYKQLMDLLTEKGIVFGVKPNRIHEVLPRKGRRGGKRTNPDNGESESVVVAEGQQAVAPSDTRIEYLFPAATAEEVTDVNRIFAEYSLSRLEHCQISLPLVTPGQELATVIQHGGESGWDVFGKKVPPQSPDEMSLLTGENVELQEDEKSCKAEIYGYARLVDGEVSVLSPIWIARNLMSASFVLLRQGEDYPVPAPSDIQSLLARDEVEYGIDQEAIDRLCKRLKLGTGTQKMTAIARGSEAVAGKDAEWRFMFDSKMTRYFPEIRRLCSRSPSLEYLESYSAGLAGRVVKAGEKLAEKLPPVEGKMGADVFGEEYLPEEPRDAVLEESEYTYISEDGSAFCAKIYGYAGFDKNGRWVRLVAPIWSRCARSGSNWPERPWPW